VRDAKKGRKLFSGVIAKRRNKKKNSWSERQPGLMPHRPPTKQKSFFMPSSNGAAWSKRIRTFVWNSEIQEIILSTNSGQIGILPNHAPLLTALDRSRENMSKIMTNIHFTVVKFY
jgi:hypothetical protein